MTPADARAPSSLAGVDRSIGDHRAEDDGFVSNASRRSPLAAASCPNRSSIMPAWKRNAAFRVPIRSAWLAISAGYRYRQLA